MDLDIDEATVVTEARKTFDLRARLAGAKRRTKTVTVFTDDATGALLGGAVDEKIGEYKTGRKIRTGLIGELDAITDQAQGAINLLDENDDDYEAAVTLINERLQADSKAVVAKIKKLRAQMKKSSMEFTLQALPDLVMRDVRRKARKALDIAEKGIPEALQESYNLKYSAIIIAASVVSWTDHESGESFNELTVEQAEALQDYLPVGQYQQLDKAVLELSIEMTITNAATDSPDF